MEDVERGFLTDNRFFSIGFRVDRYVARQFLTSGINLKAGYSTFCRGVLRVAG